MNNFYPAQWCIEPCGGGNPLVPVFDADPTAGCPTFLVQFNDLSEFFPISWEWEFPGGIPSTSTDQNPVIEYSTSGLYDVTLTVENFSGSNTLTIPGYILVDDTPVASYTYNQVGLTVFFTNTTSNARYLPMGFWGLQQPLPIQTPYILMIRIVFTM